MRDEQSLSVSSLVCHNYLHCSSSPAVIRIHILKTESSTHIVSFDNYLFKDDSCFQCLVCSYTVLCNSIERMHTFYTDRETKKDTIVSEHGENLFHWYLN